MVFKLIKTFYHVQHNQTTTPGPCD